jgi:hypothetical protein
LTVESTPRGLGAVAISHSARASIKRGKLEKVAGTAIAGEGGGEKSGDSARRQGGVRSTELDVLTGTNERLHAASELPECCLTQGLDSTQQGPIGRATTASRVHRPRPRQTPRDGPDSVLETASSGRRTLTFSTSCSLTASISRDILSWEANRSVLPSLVDSRALPLGPSLHVGACPKQAARRSAVLRAHLAACRAPRPAGKAPLNPAGPRQSGRSVNGPPGSDSETTARNHDGGIQRQVAQVPDRRAWAPWGAAAGLAIAGSASPY